MSKAKTFFKRNSLLLNWREFEKLDKTQRVNTLSMIAPVTNEEKQLLEAYISDKIETLENIISFYLRKIKFYEQTLNRWLADYSWSRRNQSCFAYSSLSKNWIIHSSHQAYNS